MRWLTSVTTGLHDGATFVSSVRYLGGEGPQAVANTVWAFATLGVQARELFAAVDGKVEWLVEEGSPQAVAITAWAFATLGVEAETLFDAIETRAVWLVEEGDQQAVSNTLWAFC
jgi:hypothetical protein